MASKGFFLAATLVAATACLPVAAQTTAVCPPPKGAALQVLGSGGPIADDARASSAYLVWLDGRSRVLIDAGGGAFLRFGEAGARFEDLDFVGISHLHTDHSADLPALLKSGSFAGRDRPLPIAGPVGDGVFPGLEAFLEALLNGESGAYGYLSSFLDGTNNTPMLLPREVANGKAQQVHRGERIEVTAMRVPHGIVPAVAFRVQAGAQQFVFASDQNLGDPAFVEFASDSDVLVMHMVVPEDVEGIGRRLHAPPSLIGDIAGRAQPGTLVLSHFMARSLRDLDDNVARVRRAYDGRIELAEDLGCIVP